MPETSLKLSNTARNVLTLAAAHDDHLVRIPQLPVAAARQVIRSLLNAGLVEEIRAPVEDADFAWRTAEDDTALMLRATAAGLARIEEPAPTEALPLADEDRGADETLAGAEPDPEGSEEASPPAGPATGPMEAFVADALNAHGGDENAPGVAFHVDAIIAPLVNAFVCELMKQERPPYIAAFLHRLDRCATERRTAETGTKRVREMSSSQRTIVDLCSRPQGATGKELAEGCGWPSIAARATCQKIADRFGYVLHESPKANGRGISFRLTAKPAEES